MGLGTSSIAYVALSLLLLSIMVASVTFYCMTCFHTTIKEDEIELFVLIRK